MHSPFVLPVYLLSVVLAALAQDQGSPVDYAPNVNQTCPDVKATPLIRVFTPANQSLHPDEQDYVNQRLNSVVPLAWQDWLGDGSGIGYNLSVFQNHTAKIGIAISGGGYRAAQYGAGVLSALDSRNASAKAAGTGGLLQVASYLAGLSGTSTMELPSAELTRHFYRRILGHGLVILQRLSPYRGSRIWKRQIVWMDSRSRPRHTGWT